MKPQEAVNPGIDLSTLEAQVRAFETQAHSLLETIQLARGTRDVTAESAAAVAREVPEPALVERIAAALRSAPLSIKELASTCRAPVERVLKELKPLRKQLWNAGTDTSPRWFLAPAPDATPEEFARAVQTLIRELPRSTAELQEATRTQGSKKVWHALVRLADAPDTKLMRIGDPHHLRKLRWFWPDAAAPVKELGERRRSVRSRSTGSGARGGSA